MSEPLIGLRDLDVGYRGRPILRGVSFEVRAGEMWFLLGPNGSGKTTLLRTLLGQLAPLRGSVAMGDPRQARRRLGFVPQRLEMNETLPTTVREFVALGLVGLTTRRAEREQRVGEALEQVGLEGFEGRSFATLSGGQRQRALLARALARRPSLLVLDEPTNGLDLTAEEGFLRVLRELHRRAGLSILFVTHDLALARHATHVALFHGGRVEAGSAPEMLTGARLSRAYDAPLAVVRDEHGHVHVEVASREGGDA